MNDNEPRRSLDRLPEEMVVRVLLLCGYRDILLFSATCKKYYNIVSISIALQLHIELEVNGLRIARDVPGDVRDHVSLLRKLRRYRDAWLDLDLGHPMRQHCGNRTMNLWELQDGVFAKGIVTFDAESSFHLKTNSLLLFPLGAVNNTRVEFGREFDEFTLDPSQDLVVLVGIDHEVNTRGWVCFHSSITGRAHPQAAHPALTIELGFVVSLSSMFDLVLDIKGDLVAVKYASCTNRLYEIVIWNWKTGALLNRIGCCDSICSFVFLDDDRLVLWCARQADGHDLCSIELLIYEQAGSSALRHEALNGQTLDISSIPSLIPTLTFQFPRLRDSAAISEWCFLLRSDYGSRASLAISAPFANSRALSLGLTMDLLHEGQNIPLRIFVDTHQLLRHLGQAKQQTAPALAWEDWGENTTRWFHSDRQNHWICWMFGSRFVIGGKRISVVDFHTPTVRRHVNRQRNTHALLELSADELKERERRIADGHWPAYLHEEGINICHNQPDGSNGAALSESAVVVDTVECDQPTSIPYFYEPVVSRLPYRIVTQVRRVASKEGWLISGGHLVGAAYGFGSSFSSNELTVYTIGSSSEATDGV
ncbi:hypothetical protein FRC08_013650 [Ceratobasidium sp. 394]|nr:hypothetical protein FRC08_013650 [Ceratobasidium sp. 394]